MLLALIIAISPQVPSPSSRGGQLTSVNEWIGSNYTLARAAAHSTYIDLLVCAANLQQLTLLLDSS